jgi:hypothetical protein
MLVGTETENTNYTALIQVETTSAGKLRQLVNIFSSQNLFKGNNNEAANSHLKEKYKDTMTLDEGLDLACQTLAKALTATLSPEKSKFLSKDE